MTPTTLQVVCDVRTSGTSWGLYAVMFVMAAVIMFAAYKISRP